MNLIFRNFIRAGIAMALLAAYTLNPETATFQDFFRLLLRAMHFETSQGVFFMAWLLFSAVDLLLGNFSGSSVAVSRSEASHSHSVSYVERNKV